MTTTTTVDAVVVAFEAGANTEAARALMTKWMDMYWACYDLDMLAWKADHVAEVMAEAVGGMAVQNARWWVGQRGADFGVVEAAANTLATYTTLSTALRKARTTVVATTFSQLLAR